MRAVRGRNHGTFQADPGTTGLLSRLLLEDARFSPHSRTASVGRSRPSRFFTLPLARGQTLVGFQIVSYLLAWPDVQVVTNFLHVLPDLAFFFGRAQQECRVKGWHHLD